jgi:hypothetical protein
LIEGTAGGGAKIIGGAGGKLNGQELGKLKPGAGGAAPEAHDPKTPLPVKGYPFRGRELPKGSANPATVELYSIMAHKSWERQKELQAEFDAHRNDDDWDVGAWSDRNDVAIRHTESMERALKDAFAPAERAQVHDYIAAARADNEKRPAPTKGEERRATERAQVLTTVHRAAHKLEDNAGRRKVKGGGNGDGRQQPLFKSRLIVPIRARLAKSTLAPVATPAREVTVGGRLAYWRESEGRGVLQIPLDTGKSLLVLARDLALALVDGAEELARVLSGQPPARALIAKLGLLKTARKTA